MAILLKNGIIRTIRECHIFQLIIYHESKITESEIFQVSEYEKKYREVVQIVFTVLCVLIACSIVAIYASIIKKHKLIRKQINGVRKLPLDLKHHKNPRVGKRRWKTKYFSRVLATYCVTAAPWVVRQLAEGSGYHTSSGLLYVVILIYSGYFICPAAVSVIMWRKQRNNNRIQPDIPRLRKKLKKNSKSLETPGNAYRAELPLPGPSNQE